MRGIVGSSLVVVLAIVAGCGSPPEAAGDAGVDAAVPSDASMLACTRDQDCDDGVYCNGAETCSAGHCVARTLPCDDGVACTVDTCSEAMHACTFRAPDADGDGIADAACIGRDGVPLGTDCDDADARTFPGNTEVCDHHDEDCDPTTLGGVDADHDGAIPSDCCNPIPGGESCGRDCDDTNPSLSQLATEICDGIDNDCDRAIDEHVLLESWPDGDGDGFGDVHATPDAVCLVPSSRANQGGDCDDTDRRVHPFQTEECNGVDDDCDGATDESTTTACNTLPGTFGECIGGHCVVTSCDATHYDCNGLDADGCEADLCGSASSCGSCGHGCGSFTFCAGGLCPGVTSTLGMASFLHDVTGAPVAGATLTSIDVCPVITGTTGADGTYVLESTSIPSVVRIRAPGYPTHVQPPGTTDAFGPVVTQSLLDAWIADPDALGHPRPDRAILVVEYSDSAMTVINDGNLGPSNAATGTDLLGFSGPAQREVFFEAVPGRVSLGGFFNDGAGCSGGCFPNVSVLLEAGAVTYVGPFSCSVTCS